MEKLPIPEEDVVAIADIAPGVFGLRIIMVNVYAVVSDAGWMLIDTGLPHSRGRIKHWTEQHFGATPPNLILLTHAHFDHAGSVQQLAGEWNVPVFVHPLELPYVTGQSQYPPPDPSVGGGLFSLLSSTYPRDPVDLGPAVRTLPEDRSIPGFPDWRWIHTPGHTDGHVSLFREHDRLLMPGDAFCTTKQESFFAVATQRPELHGPPAYFTTDWEAARESVERLAILHPHTIAPGHGQPIAGPDVPANLEALAREFDIVARPAHGKYVDQTA